jgi:Tfp pilus tip-associated adhesin PilY1
MDKTYKLWVYFGSGDKNDPTAPNSQEKFYAIRDKDRTATYYLNSLENLGDLDSAGVYSGTKDGWYLTLTGEKILAEPVVFEGRVYFTSYEPANANDPCDQAGTAKLSILDYTTGAGKATTGGAKTITLEGKGVPSAPIISRNPYGGTDVYVSTSVGKDASGGGSGGGDGKTDKVEDPNIFPFSPNSIIYWHDRRVQ